MKPLYLYIENFQCHEKSEIDFSSFNSALIVGKQNDNDLIANGVGKSSIFKSIEYVLFNQVRDPLLSKDVILEKLIRDDCDKVLVIFDFEIDSEIYRVARSRTRKGISDLSFYRRNAVNPLVSGHVPEINKELWDNITSRRTSDTEADLAKKIKLNYKSFINTVHFMQSDMTGLATATPEKRKLILKECLDLLVYAKLEKMAKTRADNLIKSIDKNKILTESLSDSEKYIEEFKEKIKEIDNILLTSSSEIENKKIEISVNNEKITELNNQLSVLETGASAVISRRDALQQEIVKLDNSVLEYSRKKKNILEQAQSLTNELKSLQEVKKNIEAENLSRIDEIKLNLNKINSDIGFTTSSITSVKMELEELKIPMPEDGTCKHCRQILTEEHRLACQLEIDKKIKDKENELQKLQQALKFSNETYKASSLILKDLEQKGRQLAQIISDISSKEKELADKKSSFNEYVSIIKSFSDTLISKKEELNKVKIEVENSSEKEINDLKKRIMENKQAASNHIQALDKLEKTFNSLSADKAVLLHSIQEKEKDLKKKNELKSETLALEKKYAIYPLVVQAFGTTGIPNFFIQDVLEDYQEEANKILAEIRPGLQLAFSTEKVKGDGNLDDTLELNYLLNNKPKDFSVLSGAQRLCIAFSLKLGLAFLLKKVFQSLMMFLLLDEIDQSLDKASTDAFAKLIKHFQQSFIILVITHNDRLKDKFSHAIVVEQDQNMVSRAKVATSW